MSIEDRDYMRTIPEGSSKKRSRTIGGLERPRQSGVGGNNNVFSRSEQFGVLLAGVVVVALLLAAIL